MLDPNTLPPGRELDRLIDQKLFGLPPQLVLVPAYSTDGNDMLLVLRKLDEIGHKVGFCYEMGNRARPDGFTDYWLNIIGPHDDQGVHLAHMTIADTLPLAVARGALEGALLGWPSEWRKKA